MAKHALDQVGVKRSQAYHLVSGESWLKTHMIKKILITWLVSPFAWWCEVVTVKWVHVCNNPTATASCHLETTKFGPSSAFKFPLGKFLWINLFDRRMKSWPAAVLEIYIL